MAPFPSPSDYSFFLHFGLGIEDFDRITTPYAPGAQPLDSGYEFLSWTQSQYGLTDRETKPAGTHYHCQEGHACHHIIPIRDLMYLWDYFDGTKNTFQQKEWGLFRKLLGELCPYDVNGHYKLPEDRTLWTQKQLTRKFFAWSWWNLFRGPKNRKDDPRWSGVQNEKERPSYFPKDLWDSVQSMFWRIQRLKELDRSPHSKKIMKAAVTESEEAILQALKAVNRHWNNTFLSRQPYTLVRQHLPKEWQQDGVTGKWYVKSVTLEV